MEAMASRRPQPTLAQLWQFPLLVVSLALFGYATYRFIDPKPGLTIDQKIAAGRSYLEQDRPKAAVEYLGNLLASEKKLDKPHEGQIHLLLAESLEAAQKQLKISIPRNYQNIIEQSMLATVDGVKPSYDFHRRLAESYEALGQPTAALSHYRDSLKFDPPKLLSVERKIINLQLAADDTAGAGVSLDKYLAHPELVASERAWALSERSHMLLDEGKFEEARKVLAEAGKIATELADLGQINYWLGYCAWKLHDVDQAERLMRVARDQFKSRHPLDGDAAYVLGRIAQEKQNYKEAMCTLRSGIGWPS